MGSFSKRVKRAQQSDSESGSEEEDEELFQKEEVSGSEEDEFETASDDDLSDEEENDGDSQEEEEDDDDNMPIIGAKDDEMEELEKEYNQIRNMEQNLMQNLKQNKDDDVVKGQAIKSQKALWDKGLELRCLLQKAFHKANKLPQEPIRSSFCELDEGVSALYSDVIASSKKTIDSLLQLEEALLENNPSIAEVREEGKPQSSLKSSGEFDTMDIDKEKEWLHISQMQSRVASFRNTAIDKWQRKADVHSGAAAKKAKLLAFNQNVSDQVATYMRDPSKMIRSMQMRRETVGVFGSVPQQLGDNDEEGNVEGDPELLDDSEFYQQLLKEFLSSESAFYELKKLQTKKRKTKVVDRRASKSRKIRYNVHEKIVNFMAPQPMDLPPMAPKLFENLFGLKTQKPTLAA